MVSDGAGLLAFAIVLLIVGGAVVAGFVVVLTIFAAGYAMARESPITRTDVARELLTDAFAGVSSGGRELIAVRTAACGCAVYPDGRGYHVRPCPGHAQLLARSTTDVRF